MIVSHSIACLLLAGYVFAPVMRFCLCGSGRVDLAIRLLGAGARKRLMGGLSVISVFDGETGLKNENEGDIQGGLRSAAVAELVDAQR